MSIILKGIDIPTKYDAPLMVLIYSNGDATATTKEMSGYNNAKAIQIPKDHRDIKDVGKLEDELDERCGQLSAEILRKAPTILEAEESNERQ